MYVRRGDTAKKRRRDEDQIVFADPQRLNGLAKACAQQYLWRIRL